MKISRIVGTLEEMVPIFVQNATVSTGVGLPNVQTSNFSAYYFRSDMTSSSTFPLISTGTLGTWSSGQWKQINSTLMMGWYQLCLPNGVFAAGSTCALHMYGHPSMAPVVAEIDIIRQNNQSTVLTVAPVRVSSMGIPVDVTSYSGNVVTVTAGKLTVDVSTFFGSRAVTTLAGTLGVGRVGVSSFALPVGVSAFALPVGVSSMNTPVDVTSVYATAVVTTVPGYFATHFDLALTSNQNSTVSFSSVNFSTLYSSVSASVGSVDVTSFSGTAVVLTSGKLTVDVSTVYGSRLVTSAAGVISVGRVGVSSFELPVGVSAFALPVGISSNSIGANITSVVGIAVTGTGTSSDPWNP